MKEFEREIEERNKKTKTEGETNTVCFPGIIDEKSCWK